VVAAVDGDVDRRCESKIFNVSLVVVLVFVADVGHGVFITSRRRALGNGVDLAVVDDDDDGAPVDEEGGNEPLSIIDIVGSVNSEVDDDNGVVVVEFDVVAAEIPLATSSITSSICDRDVVFSATFVDETMFETSVIKSVCCGVDGVGTDVRD
jgi:hypothetical protein